MPGQGKPFDARRIGKVQRAYGLNSRFKRLQAAGFLTAKQLAAKLGMTSSSLRARRAKGGLNLKTVRLVIIDAIQATSSLSKAWLLLSQRLPQIEHVTVFNIFKGYARILTFVDHQLGIGQQKLDKVRQKWTETQISIFKSRC